MKRIRKTAAIIAAICPVVLFTAGMPPESARAARIKDIADIQGVRENQLIGYGLVVGLDGTGDGNKSVFTTRALSGMLEKMGMTTNPADIKVGNVAAVVATAALPAFGRSGSRIDVVVSSIGDAKSLQGGTLVLTPLKGVDGKVYAVAQGGVSTGGFFLGGSAASVQKNYPTVGRIPRGAVIEREIPSRFSEKTELDLVLHRPDFTTALQVVDAVNTMLMTRAAEAPDPGTVRIRIPPAFSGDVVRFVTLIESLSVSPDTAARVVINERTGTVVMGEQVRISTVAVAHGNLSIQINESAAVSQPAPLSETGNTVIVPDTAFAVSEEERQLMILPSGVTIGDVVRALNSLGVSPRDLIAIFQAIRAAGALQAELEII
ncbi:MAG: flagellar biosynthesis protein FlgA [Desulfobacterales bacterium]|nr:MAG: flagellar biosynthesis protein FlgA [Desulfobacterales bacterium]